MEKTIKEIFKDYNSESFALNSGKIKAINLFKKTNKLELIIITDEFIKIEDIYKFEKYLKQRFNVFEANIKVEYTKKQEIEKEKEWNLVICYLAHKHPLSKAFLRNSNIKIEENNIIVNMQLKGKSVLEANHFDQIISEILENIYNLKYKISFIENISEEAIKQYLEHAKKLEEEAIAQTQRMLQEEKQEENLNNNENEKSKETQQEVSVSIEVPQENEEI